MSNYGTPPPPPPPPPGYGYGAPQGQPNMPAPPNYLVMSILSLLCCWPIGIPAVVFAAQVNSKWAQGDLVGARDASSKAKRFATVALALGIAVTLVYLALLLTGALGGFGTTTTTTS